VSRNPCEFSREVLEEVWPLIRPGEHIHDPFAGHGERLGRLCDEMGVSFSGGDIEVWEPHDPRIVWADALDPLSYPTRLFTIVTSPVYVNKRCADYPNGPTPNTKTRGRRDYGIALNRALHPDNLARTTGRPSNEEDYWRLHPEAVSQWDQRVILNVDEPISKRWQQILVDVGYRIEQVIPAYTLRYGGLHNAEKRAPHEDIIVASRAPKRKRLSDALSEPPQRRRRLSDALAASEAATTLRGGHGDSARLRTR
jgi:hypothetical protein